MWGLQLHPEVLTGAVGVIFPGHSEYWSRQMRENITEARSEGVNLAFLGANAIHRRIRLEDSPLGPGRVLVNYKFGAEDPVKTVDTTADWGKKPNPQPQASLLGTMYVCADTEAPMVVTDPTAWPFAGLKLAPGTQLPGVIGPEIDRIKITLATPRPIQVLAHSRATCKGRVDASDMTWYTHTSGAGVLSIGTLGWTDAMTSDDATVKKVVVGVTENVLRAMAEPRAGERHPALDNVATYYTDDGVPR